MTGFSYLERIESLRKRCDNLGFSMGKPTYHSPEDYISLYPKDQDSLPLYARDAEIYTGTLESISKWISGVEWTREYDSMVFEKSHDKKRERREQNIRNKQLARILIDT